MNENINILGIAGSLRQSSYNRALLQAAHELLPANTTLTIFDLNDIPFYNADVEAQAIPTAVSQFHTAIRHADALLIATPEYNWSIPGVLKNAIDWASRRAGADTAPIDHKPAAIMGAGGGYGTMRAQMHLREILMHNQLHVLISPALMVSRAWTQFDDNGRLTNEETRVRLQRLLAALRDWTIQLNK